MSRCLSYSNKRFIKSQTWKLNEEERTDKHFVCVLFRAWIIIVHNIDNFNSIPK